MFPEYHKINAMRTISVCIPYFNRFFLIKETLEPLLSDPRVNEIVIVDDQSAQQDYEQLFDYVSEIKKIKLFRNIKNFGNQHNKKIAASFATNRWIILLDNDNVIKSDFIDALFGYPIWDTNTIYHPEAAAPHFNYRQFSGVEFHKSNIKPYLEHSNL